MTHASLLAPRRRAWMPTLAAVLTLASLSCSHPDGPKPVATVGISPSSASMVIGTTQQLTGTTLDGSGAALTGRAMVWSVSPANVASVSSSGLVTGLAVGSATVTLTSEGKSAAIGVTVTSGVLGVSVTATSTSPIVGTALTATATVSTALATISTNVTWRTSNAAVATVAAAATAGTATVTSVTVGSTTIAAVSVADTTKQASITITVLPIPVASVTISAATTSMNIGATQQLSAILKDAAGNILTGRVVTWSSNNAAAVSVSATGLLTAVSSGLATITATSEGVSGTAVISAAISGLNIIATGVTLTQVVQRPDNSVSLVTGNAALLSVYGTSTTALGTGATRVRVRIFKGAQVLFDDTRAATSALGTTTSATAPMHQILVAGTVIQPGISVLAEINPTGTGEVPEALHTDNVFPASGTALAVDVRTMLAFPLRFIPIFLSQTSSLGTVNTGVLETKYLATMRKIHPVSSIDATIGASFTIDLAFSGGDATAFWNPALSLLDAKRVADGATQHYYGVVPLPAGTNSVSTGGVAYIPGSGASTSASTRTAMGMDATVNWSNPLFGQQTLAHELGHNMGRRHAPCGGPSNVDPGYPYAGAVIGVVGWDVYSYANGLAASPALKDPAVDTDIMSYCYDWISDYTYQGIINFRSGIQVASARAPAPPTQALLVSGTVNSREVVLNPGYLIQASPMVPDADGPYTLEGLDASGATLFRYAFAAKEIDHSPDDRQFAFALPVSDAVRDALVTFRVTGAGRAPALRRSPGGRLALLAQVAAGVGAGTTPQFSARRATPNQVRLTWNAGQWAGVMVRDPDTNEVIGFGRSGDFVVRTTKQSVVLVLSDGVQSARQLVVVR